MIGYNRHLALNVNNAEAAEIVCNVSLLIVLVDLGLFICIRYLCQENTLHENAELIPFAYSDSRQP